MLHLVERLYKIYPTSNFALTWKVVVNVFFNANKSVSQRLK